MSLWIGESAVLSGMMWCSLILRNPFYPRVNRWSSRQSVKHHQLKYNMKILISWPIKNLKTSESMQEKMRLLSQDNRVSLVRSVTRRAKIRLLQKNRLCLVQAGPKRKRIILQNKSLPTSLISDLWLNLSQSQLSQNSFIVLYNMLFLFFFSFARHDLFLSFHVCLLHFNISSSSVEFFLNESSWRLI